MIRNPSLWSALRDSVDNQVFSLVGSGGPLSGSSSRTDAVPTGFGVAGYGSIYTDLTNGAMYRNEGTRDALYWTPISFDQPGLLSWRTDFRNGVGVALADTAATTTLVESGIRICGNGVAETDSGVTVAIGEDGAIATITASALAARNIALGVGITTSVPFQPDRHGPIVVDTLIAQSSAITLRNFFLGFVGTFADAIAQPVTGAGTTLTLVQDDLAGLVFDVGLTDTDRYFAAHNKGDAAPSQSTASGSRDTGIDVAAAGTYQRLRVEVAADGTVTCFINKVQVFHLEGGLDVDEEIAPALVLGSTSSAVKSALVKHFGAWGVRANNV